MHSTETNIKMSPIRSSSFPELTWISPEDEEKSKIQQKTIDYSHLIPSCHQDLTHSLSSPVEDEQVYAAQALGQLKVNKRFIIEALWISAQIGPERVRYESSRTLALLGCFHKQVILALIEQLKGCCLSRRMDTLRGLHLALNAWILVTKHKREPIGAKGLLLKVLKLLVKGKSPLDDVALEAAMCLTLLDFENSIAQEFLLQCLIYGDMKRRMKALRVLVKLMKLDNLPILQGVMDQLQYSYLVEHRMEAIKLLRTIGLERIQELGMENEIFELLRLKVYDEPFQEVREAVAEIVEELKMKPMMLNIVESQLTDANPLVRQQAVISIGVLGICSSQIFYFLMDMLDMERSKKVRKELERLFIALAKKDPWVLEKLKDWKLPGDEKSRKKNEKVLKFEKLSRPEKSLLGELGPLIPKKAVRHRKSMAQKGRSIFGVPIKGIVLASHFLPQIKIPLKEELPQRAEGPWDSPAIREALKDLASY